MMIHFRNWQLLPARPFDWRMKPLSSAKTAMRILTDGRRELTISHDVIKGVTPEMLHWWFCHIDIVDRVVHLGNDGIFLSTEQVGVQIAGIGNLLLPLPAGISTLEHRFSAKSNGTAYESRLLIGSPARLGQWALNPFVQRVIMNDAMAKTWLKHNVEEVGNFEFFLPQLWAQQSEVLAI